MFLTSITVSSQAVDSRIGAVVSIVTLIVLGQSGSRFVLGHCQLTTVVVAVFKSACCALLSSMA